MLVKQGEVTSLSSGEVTGLPSREITRMSRRSAGIPSTWKACLHWEMEGLEQIEACRGKSNRPEDRPERRLLCFEDEFVHSGDKCRAVRPTIILIEWGIQYYEKPIPSVQFRPFPFGYSSFSCKKCCLPSKKLDCRSEAMGMLPERSEIRRMLTKCRGKK